MKSRCPHRVPAMEACRSAMPCHGDRRVPPKRATTPAPALCPLPSPGRCRSCCPGARCVPAARGEGLNRPAAVGAAAQGRLAGGREASTGLPQPVMPESSLAGPSALSLLPECCREEASAWLAPSRLSGFSSSSSRRSLGWWVRSHPRRLAGNPVLGHCRDAGLRERQRCSRCLWRARSVNEHSPELSPLGLSGSAPPVLVAPSTSSPLSPFPWTGHVGAASP